MAEFVLKKDIQRKYYWILQSTQNYKIIAKSSESYESREGAMNSITWTKNNALAAGFRDET